MKIFAFVIGENKHLSNYNLFSYNFKIYMEVLHRFDSELERQIKLSDFAPVSFTIREHSLCIFSLCSFPSEIMEFECLC